MKNPAFNPLDPDNIRVPLSDAERRLHKLYSVYPWYFATFWAISVSGFLWTSVFVGESPQAEPPRTACPAWMQPAPCHGNDLHGVAPSPLFTEELPPVPELEIIETEVLEVVLSCPSVSYIDTIDPFLFLDEYDWDALPEAFEEAKEYNVPDTFIFECNIVKSEERLWNLPEIYKTIGYPQIARDAGIEGLVVVQVRIDEQGNYAGHQFVKRVHPILDNPIEQHISLLKATPLMQNGKLIPYCVSVPFRFRMCF